MILASALSNMSRLDTCTTTRTHMHTPYTHTDKPDIFASALIIKQKRFAESSCASVFFACREGVLGLPKKGTQATVYG